MKITKDVLFKIITEELAEVRGMRNMTPEPKLSDFKPIKPKYGTTRGEEAMVAMDSESEGKNYVIRLSDGKGDFSTVYFGNLETIAKDFNEAGQHAAKNKEIAVFSVKSDRQVGSLTTDDQGKAIGFTHTATKGKKYKPEAAFDDLEDGDTDEESMMENKSKKITNSLLTDLIKESIEEMKAGQNEEVDEGIIDFFSGKKSKSDQEIAVDVENKLSDMMNSIKQIANDLNKNYPSLGLTKYLADIYKAMAPARRAIADKKITLKKYKYRKSE